MSGRDEFLTDIELLMKRAFEERGLVDGEDFVSQYPLRHSFILDFAFPEQMVAVEVDGEPWHTGKKNRQRDKIKDEILQKKGWKVIRFWGREVNKDADECVSKVLGLI